MDEQNLSTNQKSFLKVAQQLVEMEQNLERLVAEESSLRNRLHTNQRDQQKAEELVMRTKSVIDAYLRGEDLIQYKLSKDWS